MKIFYPLLILFTLTLVSCDLIDKVDGGDEPYVMVLNANPDDVDAKYVIVDGMAADGVSQLEFAIRYDVDNEVTAITITSEGESWGVLDSQLSAPVERGGLNAYRFTLTSQETLPDDLQSSSSAELTYSFDVTTSDGEISNYECTIVVVRAPVVFVHGMASDRSTYDTMLSYITPKGLYLSDAIYTADYSETALSSFDTNKSVVPDAISYVRSAMEDRGIVCERVAVVGHSMGGILSRIYMQGRGSVSYRDDIHKLITIDTPHSGSQLADFAIAFGDRDADGLIAKIAENGAIVDLAVSSDATKELNSASNLAIESSLAVPCHVVAAHIGTAADVSELVKSDETFKALVTFALNTIEKELLYNGDTSDIVVPTDSQEGGVRSGLINNQISVYSNEWHCSILASEELADKIVTLLDASTTSSYFTTDGFNPPTLTFDSTSLEGEI